VFGVNTTCRIITETGGTGGVTTKARDGSFVSYRNNIEKERMISFKPMEGSDYQEFLSYFVADYAAEIEANYRLCAQAALLQAQTEIETSLPQGEKSPGQVLLCIQTEINGKTVTIGYLWYKPDRALKSIYICDFYLHPDYRNQGFGSEALKELERMLLDEGYNQIKLRVAAENHRAKHVYEGCGFNVTGINMNKILGE